MMLAATNLWGVLNTVHGFPSQSPDATLHCLPSRKPLPEPNMVHRGNSKDSSTISTTIFLSESSPKGIFLMSIFSDDKGNSWGRLSGRVNSTERTAAGTPQVNLFALYWLISTLTNSTNYIGEYIRTFDKGDNRALNPLRLMQELAVKDRAERKLKIVNDEKAAILSGTHIKGVFTKRVEQSPSEWDGWKHRWMRAHVRHADDFPWSALSGNKDCVKRSKEH